MDMHPRDAILGRSLVRLGLVLLLAGLVAGFAVHMFMGLRMGLASLLHSVVNGAFLVLLGLVWPRLLLPRPWLLLAFGLAICGTLANWTALILAVHWDEGTFMRLAGAEQARSPAQDVLVNVLLAFLSLSMLVVSVLVLWGLMRFDRKRMQNGMLRPPRGGERLQRR